MGHSYLAHLLLPQNGGRPLSVEERLVLSEGKGSGAVGSAATVVCRLGQDFLIEVEEDVDDGGLWG